MTLFAGNTVLYDGDVVRFGRLRLWAERGLVHVEDERDGSYNSFSVRTMLERMRAIRDLVANSRALFRRQPHTEDQFDSKWLRDNEAMLEAMTEVVRRAQEQGMPSDPSARRDLLRRRPRTFVLSGPAVDL